jgi:hypothetical protein
MVDDLTAGLESSLNNLRAEAAGLLDSKFNETTRQSLLSKIVDLEDPSLNLAAVDFLSEPNVCDQLLNLITIEQDGENPRFTERDKSCIELKNAFRATCLMTSGESSHGLASFMEKCAKKVALRILNMFTDKARGSFHHAEEVIVFLLRYRSSSMHEAFLKDGPEVCKARLLSILRYIGYDPVSNIVVMLVTEPHLPPMLSIPDHHLKFLKALKEMGLFECIGDVIFNPEAHCACSDEVPAGLHAAAAVNTMMELMERLMLSDPGSFLGTLSACGGLFHKIVSLGVDSKQCTTLRLSCLRLYQTLMRQSREPNHYFWVQGVAGKPPSQTQVVNELYHVRMQIIVAGADSFPEVTQSLAKFDDDDVGGTAGAPVEDEFYGKHPGGYTTPRPFGSLRLMTLSIMRFILEGEGNCVKYMTAPVWATFISWMKKYPHNNMYQVELYKLFFMCLRSGENVCIESIFSGDSSFLDFLCTHFSVPISSPKGPRKGPGQDWDGALSKSDALYTTKMAIRGFVMDCLNAIRLYSSSLPPSHLLRVILDNHPEWNRALPLLIDATELQQRNLLGVDADRDSIYLQEHRESAVGHLASILAGEGEDPGLGGEDAEGAEKATSPRPTIPVPDVINFGSSYARNLGFSSDSDSVFKFDQEGNHSFDHDDDDDDDEFGVD